MSQDKIQGILKYVDQYDLDGIDLDYENDPGCQIQGALPKCSTDAVLTDLIKDFGNAIKSHNASRNKKILLTAAPFSVGAYYYGKYKNAKPQSSHSGMWVNPLMAAGHHLDLINIMSYDAGHYTFMDTT
jgi:GH18 family chitinase